MQEADLISNNETTAFQFSSIVTSAENVFKNLCPLHQQNEKNFELRLHKKEGIKFSKPMKCVSRKHLADDVKTSILKFYENDSISYQAAGRGAFKKISVNGEIKEVQIRYLVVTLKEALFVLNHKEMYIVSVTFHIMYAHALHMKI